MHGPKVFYSPDYYADIGEDHVFPIRKFEIARDTLINEGTVRLEDVLAPREASVSDVLRVHTENYVSRLRSGHLTKMEVRRLGLPWSESLVKRSFLAVSGTINAAFAALNDGVGSNLAGGTHHAYPDRGEGFCVLNDVAIAIERLRADKAAERFLVVDLDVHQGNGTAFIYADDPEVFTFSMHGQKNYPLYKEKSDLDIELADGTRDGEFHSILSEALSRILHHEPDIIFYLAGADPFVNDKLGRLALTKDGLRERDRIVLEHARLAGVPVVTTMSGGYAVDILDTVEIHCNTIRAVREVFCGDKNKSAVKSATAASERPNNHSK
ncbi:MAG: histone deacetylase [Acidobacteria bacterium]|nr:MAG: histone deacetylase [Acidobacteriota bacterium]REK02086.1 MAG: histone deacetylase [Acidobacteriota bacterium]REK15044.1 MAG: histone deacetylase [Acidobacteriota bacterium]REK45758.1 MAG: histone deacetylase [Acidobacteriota bacterium]